jgi:hypothetical protein
LSRHDYDDRGVLAAGEPVAERTGETVPSLRGPADHDEVIAVVERTPDGGERPSGYGRKTVVALVGRR